MWVYIYIYMYSLQYWRCFLIAILSSTHSLPRVVIFQITWEYVRLHGLISLERLHDSASLDSKPQRISLLVAIIVHSYWFKKTFIFVCE